jgi:hypothetical protein
MTEPKSESRITSIKVAKVIDEYTLVINKGLADGVKAGQRFLIYTYGDEVIDPDTRVSLGKLEIVKGTGRVSHLQGSMATVRSDMTAKPSRSTRKIKRQNPFGGILGNLGTEEEIEESLPATTVPFEEPKVGDLVKPV